MENCSIEGSAPWIDMESRNVLCVTIGHVRTVGPASLLTQKLAMPAVVSPDTLVVAVN